jgi:RNA-binding protein Musashi
VELMRDRNTGKPRGFGFVVFKDGSSVDLVLETSVHEINHKVVDVKRAQARGVAPPSIHQDYKPTTAYQPNTSQHNNNGPSNAAEDQSAVDYQKVFVGGIPISCGKEELTEIFSEFGTVVDTIIMV